MITSASPTGNRSAPWFAVVMLTQISLCNAEPVVIYNSGNTRPITDYLFLPGPESIPPSGAVPPAPDPQSLASRIYPVHTPEMTPGDVQTRNVNFPQLPRPVFLIGTDDRSRNWLLRYRERLREVRAIGLVVEAASEQNYLSIQEIAGPLDLAPPPEHS
ncbi:MAG: PFL_4695 family integrating conjugative element protein [Blastocatellia bacterium]